MKPQTLVIGMDALDFRYLDRFIDSLPHFRALREQGLSAPLESTFPPWTASAWASMYTGCDPSYHGVYDFFSIDDFPDRGSLVTRQDVELPAFWDYLTDAGKTSIVVNVPVTYPAAPLDGVLVPGYLAPESAAGYPPGIREEISEAIGEPYHIYARNEASSAPTELSDFIDTIELRKRAALYLLNSVDWDLAFVQVQKTDNVFHVFDDDAAFERVYRAADELLGELLNAAGEGVNAIVCSDHGIGPKRGHGVFINEILRKHGYVTPGAGGTGRQLKHVKNGLTDGTSTGPEHTSFSSSMLTWLIGRYGSHLPTGQGYAALQRLGIADWILEKIPQSVRSEASEGIDWTRSRAYCRSATRLGIRLNLDGRDPGGVVPESEYEAVRDDLIALLRELETPDGRKAFETVVRREALYDGPHLDRADDILLVPRGMDNGLGTELFGLDFVPVDDHDHKRTGVFLAAGPAFNETASLDRPSLTDVAPVIMSTLDLPVPDRMTGSVPTDLLAGPVETATYDDVTVGHADGTETDLSADEAASMEKRLEDLGYL